MSINKKQDKQQNIPVNDCKKSSNLTWWYIFGLIIVLTIATRFWNVSQPDHVCWDETHFGKMGSWYINRTFFFDVHPPLGKMLIGFSGYLTGYDGKYPFEKPGDKYGDTNYIGMRLFCTLLGSTIVPLAFLIVWDLTLSIRASTLSAIFVLFDSGMLTLNRYILLDPILLCFMMCSTWGMTRIGNYKDKEFTPIWWFWMIFTGISLSCVMAVKFVGLFVVILVGFYTIYELWRELGDLTKPFINVVKQLFARALCLIIIPSLFYILFFYIHLQVLNKSGSGDGFFSSEYQSLFEGNSLYNSSMPRDLAYGAKITIKNHRAGGGYLHSHWHLYPEGIGARQQQITTYSHKDENNLWLVKKFDTNIIPDKPEFIKSGDLIRLEHIITKRNLHSHKEPAPVTKKHYQVTGYGENGTGDANDVWKIVIENGNDGDIIRTVTTKFKLFHYLQHCVLVSTKILPKWAFDQQEVSCDPNIRSKSNLWNIETNNHDKLPNISLHVYAPSFISRFIESHNVMLQGNSQLKIKEGEVTSRPWQWPINYRGQYFSGSPKKIYLLGNPIIWWNNIIFIIIFLIIYIYTSVQKKRCNNNQDNLIIIKDKFRNNGGWLFIAWLLHYLPFWCMTRILYFHHYFPALIYNTMLTSITINFIMDYIDVKFKSTTANTINQIIFGFIISTIVYSFYLFAPLTYGFDGPTANSPNSTMYGLKWMDSWEF
ncbi:hypothetical protein HCN44_000600 [Aphidius gifuensis]|uniref:Protein O-mannosyl-transferase 2 n=1 Tax=Aphidius gifuensis TaxID=684658 RepID=A0A834XP70_APHGI|nr:protein O-mannosyl-transferase 2 [Aphidius gifuensis]KAF7990795.1 hypothetical protein HCN44_000600 [Aphidius gifuensis]